MKIKNENEMKIKNENEMKINNVKFRGRYGISD